MGKWHSKSQILFASYQHYLVEALGSQCSAWDFPRFQAQGWEQEEGPGAEGERAKGTEPATHQAFPKSCFPPFGAESGPEFAPTVCSVELIPHPSVTKLI